MNTKETTRTRRRLKSSTLASITMALGAGANGENSSGLWIDDIAEKDTGRKTFFHIFRAGHFPSRPSTANIAARSLVAGVSDVLI